MIPSIHSLNDYVSFVGFESRNFIVDKIIESVIDVCEWTRLRRRSVQHLSRMVLLQKV